MSRNLNQGIDWDSWLNNPIDDAEANRVADANLADHIAHHHLPPEWSPPVAEGMDIMEAIEAQHQQEVAVAQNAVRVVDEEGWVECPGCFLFVDPEMDQCPACGASLDAFKEEWPG